MISYYQETNSEVIFASPPFLIEPTTETIGSSLDIYFSLQPEDSSLVKSARETTYQTENQKVAQETRRLLSIVQRAITSFQRFGVDLGHLPPLGAFNVDDGSVLIEWIFSDFRIGFNVEPDPDDSGWYLVSNKNLGEISASGYTSGAGLESLVLWLLGFILSNY